MLMDYGWADDRQHEFERYYSALTPARVVEQQRGQYRLVAEAGVCAAHVSGRFAHEAEEGALPAVGDWVAIAPPAHDGPAIIHAVLARSSVFQRKFEGRTQTICANLDIALLATALNGDFNLRRLERYLAVAREGGATPIILLTKADLCDDADARRIQVEAIANGAAVLALSVFSGVGLNELTQLLPVGKTAALLGSSGVGKSTLVNALAGRELMHTSAISGDDKRGRHTTTHRELILLPSGVLLLDSPGLRELSVAAADEGVAATFADVEAILAACRFSDCSHSGEPGCAVAAALQDGALDGARWASYEKLQRELAFEARRDDPEARAAHREKWMRVAKGYRAQKKFRARLEDD